MNSLAIYGNSTPSVLPHSLETLKEKFLASLDVGPNSKQSYSKKIKGFFEWVQDFGKGKIDREAILRYKDSLVQSAKSPNTISAYITVVRLFFEWTEIEGLFPNVSRGIKNPKIKRDFKKQPLSVGKTKEILEYVRYGETKRNYAMVNLLLRGGLRTIELTRLQVKDIQYRNGTRVLMIHGKGRSEKDDFILLTDKAYLPIRKYLETRPLSGPDSPLFCGHGNRNRGRAIRADYVSKLVKKYLRGVNLDSEFFTAHSLRHTTAVSILKGGGTLKDAQNVLRHSNTSTTEIYTHTLKDEIRVQEFAESIVDGVF